MKEPIHCKRDNFGSWDKMCRPKKMGGLGFRKKEATNKAFLSKLVWRVMSDDDNLWIQIVKNKYLREKEFMATKSKDTDSWAWKKISNTRDSEKRNKIEDM